MSHEEDFPKNEVILYDWTEDTENAQIKSAALPSQKEKIRTMNQMFMDVIQSFDCIPKKE